MLFYSTFPKGFLNLITEILTKELHDLLILQTGNDFIHYQTSENINKITNLVFFEQTVLIFNFFPVELKSFDNILSWFNDNQSKVNQVLTNLEKNISFRIVGTSINLDNSQINNKLKNVKTNLQLNNSNPDYDIRIVERKDYGYLGVRITNSREYIDTLQKGSLRKEIAYMMLYLSEIQDNDVFIDPFCGYGVIPILRATNWKYERITASDIDTTKITNKLNILNSKFNNFNVVQSDISNLKNKINTKYNKVVTDIPWGKINNIDNLKDFYFEILDTIYAICKNNSVIILLTPHIDIVNNYLKINKMFIIDSIFKGEVSGRESNIIKLVSM